MEQLHERAATFDVSTADYLRSVLTEGLRTRKLDGLAIAGLERNPPKQRRSRTGTRKWVPVNPSRRGDAIGPATWESGDWTLIRQGSVSKSPKVGDGWYLIGPDMDEPHPVGFRRIEAVREADEYIVIAEAKRQRINDAPPDTEPVPTSDTGDGDPLAVGDTESGGHPWFPPYL